MVGETDFGTWELKEVKISEKKNRIAWVVPTLGTNEKLVLAQIQAWKKQSNPSDLIIVATNASPLAPMISKITGPINLLERRADTGAAGGFFSGERWAYARGYEKIMVTDDDAVPVSEDLIEQLSRSIDGGTSVSYAQNKVYGKGKMNVAMCTMFDRKVFQKIGFAYAPYFMFWEDLELSNRIIEAGLKTEVVDVFYDHPRPKLRPLASLYYLTRNQCFYYLYQKPSFLRFLNGALFAFSMAAYYKRKGDPAERLMREAVEDAIKRRLMKKEVWSAYPEETPSFSFSKPLADLDSSSSKLAGKIREELSSKMPVDKGEITVFSANPVQRLFRFARRTNREVVVFNELALTNLLLSKKIVLYHEPTQKFHYYFENSQLQIASNLVRAALFSIRVSLTFLLTRLKSRLQAKNDCSTDGFGLGKT